MIRAAIIVFLVAALATAILAITGEPGHASVIWLGWRADMTAAAFVLITLFVALCAMMAWRLLLWAAEAPRRAARARADTRRRQANDVLTRGFVAAAAGDGSEARRLALKAADLADEAPGLVRVLAAQAAEAAGDAVAAQAAYTAMLGLPDMRLAGHKGLMQLALNQGDRAGAIGHAEQAYGLTPTGRWAWRALLEARLEAGDWTGARDLAKGALDRKIVSPIVAERARAALLAASAAQLEAAADPKSQAQALDFAVEAAKLQPGFAPGVVMAARLLGAGGKAARAAQVLEGAWKASPHPALWLAYRDLRTNETPRQRADRLRQLAELNPAARESRILLVEQALIGGDTARAQDAARALEAEPVTARIAGLMARVAFAAGQPDEARVWMARGVSAEQEADWSDLDPEGRAFAYEAADWGRLVASFAETGELIHPRHERREPAMGELPLQPISYVDSAAFLAAHESAPAPYPIDEGVYEDDEPPVPPAPQAGQRRPQARRRLASAPRVAK
ncbi:MAG: heme biosynthesis HemY N-terminal domain-containing protein [Pseudomonadota bacterium]|uniref:heme biosynthesis HemY N-terminal domain-containing protein n=1 Tax=Phenylobacterium sp. TaxID=1871053 RepID=UPI0025E46526|nr:heme biosynthesis HemY N-terminal domain-containing protein [Phenylobacterium sp.]MBT9472000.1 heme biosynthesis protein HemY [Phenylobacterium sp.]